MLVEFSQAENSIDDISRVIHNDNGSSAESRPSVFEVVIVHKSFTALFLGKHGD